MEWNTYSLALTFIKKNIFVLFNWNLKYKNIYNIIFMNYLTNI